VDTKPKQRRRRFTAAYRRRVVEQTLTGADSVSVVARRHDLNANLVFKWRQRYRRGELTSPVEPSLVPIRLTPAALAEPADNPSVPASPAGRLDIALAGGHRLSVHGDVDAHVLRLVLETLR